MKFGTVIRDSYGLTILVLGQNTTKKEFTTEDGYTVYEGDCFGFTIATDDGQWPLHKTAHVDQGYPWEEVK